MTKHMQTRDFGETSEGSAVRIGDAVAPIMKRLHRKMARVRVNQPHLQMAMLEMAFGGKIA